MMIINWHPDKQEHVHGVHRQFAKSYRKCKFHLELHGTQTYLYGLDELLVKHLPAYGHPCFLNGRGKIALQQLRKFHEDVTHCTLTQVKGSEPFEEIDEVLEDLVYTVVEAGQHGEVEHWLKDNFDGTFDAMKAKFPHHTKQVPPNAYPDWGYAWYFEGEGGFIGIYKESWDTTG